MKCNNMLWKTLTLFLFLLLHCMSSDVVAGKLVSEKTILLEFKKTVSDPSGLLSSWNPDSTNHHCSWFGITCNSNSRVVSLNLTLAPPANQKGNSQAPSCSTFPFFGFGLKRKCLTPSNGKLSGQISPFIGFLTELRVLSIACNDLSGQIPREIWGLEKLEVLDLEGNLLTGNLPDEFEGLRKLRVLNLPFNRIDGEIPLSLSNCADLEVLNLVGNEVEGSVPQIFGSFGKLRKVYLSNNRLNGLIPTEFGINCPYLEHLDLSGNFLVGRIPGELGNCRNLKTLLLFSNRLTGVIPRELSQLSKLEVLDISRNNLSGSIPAELGQCAELSVLVLSDLYEPPTNEKNTRGDGVPVAATEEYNNFQGSIPGRITSLLKLRVVWAPRANFDGKLPSNWGSCESLEMVNLAQNQFNGKLVGVFDRCRKLYYLNLSSNMLAGQLDHRLPVPCMTVFDVSRNLMSGLFPKFDYSICPSVPFLTFGDTEAYNPSIAYELFFTCKTRQRASLPFGDATLVVIHNFGGNYFTGHMHQLPVAPKRLGKMTGYAFLASGNQLTGSFPGILFEKCNKLHALIADVSSNKFYGRLPLRSSAICPSLRFLDISKNCIKEIIPQSLKHLRALLASDVNRKTPLAQVPPSVRPLSRSLSSSDPTSSNQNSESNSTSSSDQTGSSGMHSIVLASIVSASAIVSVILILVVLYFTTRKIGPKSRVQVAESREITVFSDIGVPLTYGGIIQATGNFNTSHCIGNGGFGATYKAEISSGRPVAVKRLSVGRFQGVQQFETEIKTLERVRHPNLVTLIGYHASENEMFLIYNYLPGGNLENFIRERSAKGFGWKILHKIALDVASALAYLHDRCAPKVLHRDVKPSNILLDDQLNAFLSDFGLSRLLGTSQTHATTGVAGTFGYVAPEYAMTCRVSEKADVYSYGVVLLELLSDKKALDPSFSSQENGFNIVSWALMMLRQGQAKDVFTEGLWDEGPHDDLVEILYLAIQCTVDSLSTRPTMKQVVQRLKQIRPS